MRYPYGEVLGAEDVIHLALGAAAQLEIRVPRGDTLRKMISKPHPMPMIYRRSNAVLWVDRYYIAFISDDTPWVQYLYLTRQHIIEERIAALHLCRQRGTISREPDPVHCQFAAAWREMNRSGKRYALRPFAKPQGETEPLNSKAPLTLAPSITPALPAAGPW